MPKKQQDEPKRAIRSFKDLKTAFSKPLKNIWFLHVFGSRGFPREPQETQEGSQEEPKELQNPQQKDQQLSPKINIFLINFGQIFGIKNAQKITQEIPKNKKQIKQMNLSETQVDQHKKNKGPVLQHKLDQPFCTKSETDLQEKPR